MKNVFLPSVPIIFFSETWLRSPSPKISGKDFFFSEAVASATGRGRPSGGLEFYIDPPLKPSVISKTAQHLCVKVEVDNTPFAVVGVYYKPTLDLDDVILDLTVAIDKCRDLDLPVLLGGDFNFLPGSDNFTELIELLSSFDITLSSDPSLFSFVGHQGKSTPDHVFSSHTLVCSTSTIARPESPHLPLSAIIKCLRPYSASDDTNMVPILDYEQCISLLSQNELSQSNNPSVLVDDLNGIITACVTKKVRRLPSPPWHSAKLTRLKNNSVQALKSFLDAPSPLRKRRYMDARKAVTAEIHQNTKKFYESKVAEAIKNAHDQGISSLYKSAKKSSPDLSSNVPLGEWKTFCSNLYQTYPAPEIPNVQSATTELGSNVSKPFSPREIFDCINKQKSKAKDLMGISPADLKVISSPLSARLTPIFNGILDGRIPFPETWLNSTLFFLHKKGPANDPSNYRSLAIESPILKIFTSLITARLSEFAESSNVLPDFQFGFRKGHSSTSAALLLQQTVKSALNRKEKVFSCFVDFRKAFDLVDRSKLYSKLIRIGLPYSFCHLLNSILSGLTLSVRSNGSTSSSFTTNNGLPQGDPLSPLLFSIFIHDLPDFLSTPPQPLRPMHGIPLIPGSSSLKYILYADDLVLLSSNPIDLQQGLLHLERYCDSNNLPVSIPKTKVLQFYRGSPCIFNVQYKGNVLEQLNEFVYLGISFTTQLASTKHINRMLAKCRSRMAFLFSRLPISDIPLPTALEIFNVFILSIIRYALPVWFPSVTVSSKTKLDSLYTKYLKRFLGLPYSASNALVYRITNTAPLSSSLPSLYVKSFDNLTFPRSMEGIHLYRPLEPPPFTPIPLPEKIRLCPVPIPGPNLLPTLKAPKRAFLYTIFDLFHPHLCSKVGCSHLPSDPDTLCICRHCSTPIDHYHTYVCPTLCHLSPCALLKSLNIG